MENLIHLTHSIKFAVGCLRLVKEADQVDVNILTDNAFLTI